MSGAEWIIAGLSLYGAGVATYLIAVPWWKRRRDIAVTATLGYLNQGHTLSEPMVVMSACNRGPKPVTLTTAGLRFPGGQPVAFLRPDGEASLPYLLASGKTCRLWVPACRVAKALKDADYGGRVKIRAFFVDEVERTHIGPTMVFTRDAYEQVQTPPAGVASVTVATEPAQAAAAPAFKW